MNDYELQNLINELSVDGKRPPDNGKGKVCVHCKQDITSFYLTADPSRKVVEMVP